jgi:hypothetical protein
MDLNQARSPRLAFAIDAPQDGQLAARRID